MAFPTAVNDQITDSVTQSNVQVIADAPAIAMGSLYQSNAHAMGLSYENAVANQQQQNSVAASAVSASVARILQ
jgi:hypothetical protein